MVSISSSLIFTKAFAYVRAFSDSSIDRLACFEYTSGPEADSIREYYIKVFKEDIILV